MNKRELIDAVSHFGGVPKDVAKKTISAILQTIVSSVAKGEPVTITGFGTFHRVEVSPRSWKHPKTGLAGVTAATNVPRFRPGREFRRTLNLWRTISGVDMEFPLEFPLEYLVEEYGDDIEPYCPNELQLNLPFGDEESIEKAQIQNSH